MGISYDRRYPMSAQASILGALLILVVPVLIYLHPLMDPALAAVPAAIGFRLFWPRQGRPRWGTGGAGDRRRRPLT
ncbi:hypothetical protein [Kineococcus radiotolerans]|nr:hypothetical protein [Kineococcus radiotolerans]